MSKLTIRFFGQTLILVFGLHISAYGFAHVTVEPKKVENGTYQKLTFSVSHGCGVSPTKEVTVLIPLDLQGAKPMPKVGWEIEVEKQDLAKPYFSHGKEIRSDVRRVTWRGGNLPNDHFDEFSIKTRVVASKKLVPIQVYQICESGKWEWIDIPEDGKHSKAPAPVIEILDSVNHKH